MKPTLLVLAQLVSALWPTSFHSSAGGVARAERARVVEEALPNDNRVAAGRLVDGVLTIDLEAREVLWYLEGKPGVALPAYAFAEVGKPPNIPGPMIRVPAGTEIHATVRNALPTAMRFRGMQDHGGVLDTTVIAPGATQEFRFRAGAPGTYYYFARTGPIPARPLPGETRDAGLTGAFIVDSAGVSVPRNERVLVINLWADSLSPVGPRSAAADRIIRREFSGQRWMLLTVNGLSWPHTERLSYTAGDTVHWRVINASAIIHPMHLHGFYFDVESRGNAARDTIYETAQRRKAVTEPLPGGTTMTMTWLPTRPGNWLFHCHFTTHIAGALQLGGGAARDSGAPANAHATHAESGMAGLVVGIRVAPAKGVVVAGEPRARRKLRLFVTERAGVYGDQPGLSYVLQEGPKPPAADSVRTVSSTIFLREHEPTEITVLNRAQQMATVHWHGIELESFYDGVGDWSGWGTRVAPAIAPGDSFVVRLTPQRAGTFIYHAHTDESVQLASGLFGTLIVLPDHGARDTTERVFLFGWGGPKDDALPTVNGLAQPAPVELRAGVPHRFRLINISPFEQRIVRLMADTVAQEWRAVAKDGADLPQSQATVRPAVVTIRPGETFDFEVMRAHPESLTLQVESTTSIAVRMAYLAGGGDRRNIPVIVAKIPVTVR